MLQTSGKFYRELNEYQCDSNKYGTNPRFWTPPRFSWLWFEFWFLRLFRIVSQRSTLQIVALAFVLYSILSLLILYVHLMYFNDSSFSKHASEHEHQARGQLSVLCRDPTLNDIDYEMRYRIKKADLTNETVSGLGKSVNLLNTKLLNSNEMTHIGWFSDHYRWDSRVKCFNNRWSSCDYVFTAKCKLETIRAIYQYVPFKLNNITSLVEHGISPTWNDDRNDVFEVFISLRANAEELVEQDTNVAFFGLLALVSFTDGSQEILRLGFQPEIDNWSVRSTNFKSPKPIQSVVVMLTCLGYGGSVSFTDVRLSVPDVSYIDPVHSVEKILSRCVPNNNDFLNNKDVKFQSKEKKNDKLKSRYKKSEHRHLKHYETLTFDKEEKISGTVSNLISFVTQVSIDRLTVLEYSLQTWIGGALSLVIHVSIATEEDDIKDWQRLYVKKKIIALNLSLSESSIILATSVGNEDYPINSLRNLAIQNAKTPFLMLLDADFQPSLGLAKNFKTILNALHFHNLSKVDQTMDREVTVKSYEQTKINKFFREKIADESFYRSIEKVAFVVPAFGYIEMPKKEDPIVGSKDELLELIHREEAIIEPFRLHESSDAHKLTNYFHWYHSKEPYDIVSKFYDKYEPYVIVRKTDSLPLYSEQLTNYGMNKVMHITELFASHYRFNVLHNVWAIHIPHRTSRYYQDFMQNLDQRLINRAQRFKILEGIILQYNVLLRDCQTLNVQSNK